MAGVPIYESEQRVPQGPQATLQPVNVPVADQSAIGRAIGDLGQAGVQYATKLQAAQAETEEARLKTEFLPALHNMETAGVRSTDYRGAPGSFTEASADLIKDKSAQIQDPVRRANFTLWATSAAVTSRGRVEKVAIANEQDANAAGYETRATQYQRLILDAGSPIERQSIIDKWNADIDGQTKAGWASDTVAVARREKQSEMIGKAVIAKTNEGLEALRNRLTDAADAPSVQATTASIIREGDALLVNSGLPPIQADAALREWHRQAAEAGLRRLAVIDPEAARVVGGRSGPGASLTERIIAVESGGDATARNQNSTATGAGQFIEATWLNLMSTYRPELVTGRTREQVLALRTDPALSRDMVSRYAEQNAAVLRARGLPTTDANIYLSHFLGPGGAVGVLSVDPRTKLSEVLTPGQIAANRSVLEGKTAGDVVTWARGKVGAGTAAAAGGGDPLFASVPFEKRVAILDAAESHAASAAATLSQQADKLRKAQSDEVLREAYSRADKGELTGVYVEAIRPLLSPTEYKSMLNLLGPDAASDDTEAMIDLTRRLDSDDPQEFQKGAADYLRRGKLKTATFLALSEKNRSARRDDAPASAYRSGRDLVKSALDPGLLVEGPARAPLAAAQATALAEYDNWAQANPQAIRADALGAAQDVVKRYQVVDFGRAKISLGQSRYFGGKDRGSVTLDDVTAAEDALNKDDAAGRVTPAQMLLEVQRLRNWRGILEREQKPKEVPRGSGGK